MTEDELVEEFTLVRADAERFRVWVKVIQWHGPHSATENWLVFGRAVRTPAAAERLRRRAIRSPRFFGTCRFCHKVNPRGWMTMEDVCTGCAEGRLGVVH